MNTAQVLNLVIAALGLTPEVFDKIASLREKAGRGQKISEADLAGLLASLEARSSRIQSA